MRAGALVAFVGIVALVAAGCYDPAPTNPPGFGQTNPAEQSFSAVDPASSLTQFITVEIDPTGSTDGQAGTTMISTYVRNLTDAPITAVVRTCGISAADLQTGSGLNLVAVPPTACNDSTDTATVVLQPFQSTFPFSTDFKPVQSTSGTFALSIRVLVSPQFWPGDSIVY